MICAGLTSSDEKSPSSRIFVAAVAIAGVLLAVITSGQVQDALLKFILWVIKGFISVVE